MLKKAEAGLYMVGAIGVIAIFMMVALVNGGLPSGVSDNDLTGQAYYGFSGGFDLKKGFEQPKMQKNDDFGNMCKDQQSVAECKESCCQGVDDKNRQACNSCCKETAQQGGGKCDKAEA